jgi:hypothetical protein
MDSSLVLDAIRRQLGRRPPSGRLVEALASENRTFRSTFGHTLFAVAVPHVELGTISTCGICRDSLDLSPLL